MAVTIFKQRTRTKVTMKGPGAFVRPAQLWARQHCSSYDRATRCGISNGGKGDPTARAACRTHTNKEQITKLGSTQVPHACVATSLARGILRHGAVACAPPGLSPGSDIPQSSV